MTGQKKEPEDANPAGPINTAISRITVNLADITCFFKFLDPTPTARFTCEYFDAGTTGPRSKLDHYTLEEILHDKRLLTPADPGPNSLTLHTTLNSTDLKGKSFDNIDSARCLCVDLDTLTSSEEMVEIHSHYLPNLVVESSPNKYHLYWKVSPPFPLEHWKKAQGGLAGKLKGDISLDNITHMIRVPGVPRLLKDNLTWFVPRIIFVDPNPESITSANWLTRFPFIPDFAKKVKAKKKADIKRVQKALQEANGKIDSIEVGDRNNTLFHLCKELARTNPEVTESDVIEYGIHTNSAFKTPLKETEVLTASKSGWKIGESLRKKAKDRKQKLKELPTAEELIQFINSDSMAFYKEAYHPHLPPFDVDPVATLETYTQALSSCSAFHDRSMTDYILGKNEASLFRLSQKDVFAFDVSINEWVHQTADGRTIINNMTLEALAELIAHPLFIPLYCKALDPFAVREGIQRIYSNHNVSGLERAVITSGKLKKCTYHIFDSDLVIFKCSNGVINIEELNSPREALPTDYLLCSSPVIYDASATCPNWERFLTEIFPDTPEIIPFMQELFGYSLTGLIDEQKIFIHVGEGANGKSKVLDVLRKILGGYCTIISSEDIGVSKNRKNSPQQSIERMGSKVQGKRCAVLDDLATRITLNEGLVKTLTYKEMRADAKYENSRVIPNRCKFHIGTNTLPIPESENEGMARRVCIIPYSQKFTHNAETSRRIDDEHEAELSGILNWAIAGWKRVKERGGYLSYPECVQAALTEYKKDYFVTEQIIRELFAYAEPGEEHLWITSTEACNAINAELKNHDAELVNNVTSGKELRKVFPKLDRKSVGVSGKKLNLKLVKDVTFP